MDPTDAGAASATTAERPDWADGYSVDVEYVTGFQKEAAPSWLTWSAAMRGAAGPDLTKPNTWVEPGCGNGLTAAIIGALNPGTEAWGLDFDQAAIERAQALARRMESTKTRFQRMSFAEMTEAAASSMPAFDFVAMHGVLSWVSAARRDELCQFLTKRLTPRGLAYLSHNVDTGWAPMRSVHALMRLLSQSKTSGEGRLASVPSTIAILTGMRASGAVYFANQPTASALLDSLATEDPRYVVHEHMNVEWHPLSFEDVNEFARRSGMKYVGSATPTGCFDDATLPPMMMALVMEPWARDIVAIETMRDIGCGRGFRQDVYRHCAESDEPLSWEPLWDMRLAGVGIPPGTPVQIEGTLGTLQGDAERHDPVLAALLQGPITIGSLRTMPAFAAMPDAGARRVAAMLVGAGMAQPLLPAGALQADRAAVRAVNAEIARVNGAGGTLTMLAAPAAGTCIGASQAETLVVAEVDRRPGPPPQDEEDVERVAQAVLAGVISRGGTLEHGSKTVTDPSEVEMIVRSTTERALFGRRRKALEDLGVFERQGH